MSSQKARRRSTDASGSGTSALSAQQVGSPGKATRTQSLPSRLARRVVQRAVENPQDLKNPDGSAATRLEAPDLSEGYGHDAPDQSAVPGQSFAQAKKVTLKHTKTNPLQMCGQAKTEDLYEEVAEGGAAGFWGGAGGGEVSVNAVNGSVQAPVIQEKIEPNTIFIDNQPVELDVQQGGIGSCYFLAAVLQIVSKDPGKIKSSISGTPAGATVNLFHYDAAQGKHVPVSFSTDGKLAQQLDAQGNAQGLKGSGFRVAEKASYSEWYAEVAGGTLSVVRRDFLEVALWAPYLEKAFARYAEKYGQYGGTPVNAVEGPAQPNKQTDDQGNQKSGYDIISGGWEYMVYSVFYGDAVKSKSEIKTSYTPGADAAMANKAGILELLKLEGKGIGANQKAMVTAGGYYTDIFPRLESLIDAILAGKDGSAYPTFIMQLRYIKTLIGQWSKARAAQSPDEPKWKEKVSKAARNIAAPESWPVLHREKAPASFKALLEFLAVALNAGTDSDPGQRFMYSEHAYSVSKVTFVDKNGAVLNLTPSTLQAMLAQIDSDKSTVVIRNPHRTNEPDVHGEWTTEDGSDDGIFTISLTQFFRSFTAIDVGVVDK